MLATVFVGGLVATLVAGLIWAYTPVGEGGVTFVPDQVPDDGQESAEATPAAGATAPETVPEPTPTPTPTPTEEEDDTEEILAAAADPTDTTVQVLEAGGGAAATQAAASVLRDLGYVVNNVTSARAQVERTTVWFTSGNEPEAQALRARDSRFAEVTANQGLNEATDLHVLVGSEWGD